VQCYDEPTIYRVRQTVIPSTALAITISFLALPACAALESCDYQTVPGTTIEERGDRVEGGSRITPLFATMTFDWIPARPSLTAVITNAPLEGGEPFPLTIRSSSGTQSPDGSYRFTGDYLGDIYPLGTQYVFDWSFSASTNGGLVWNGQIYWAGGHIWLVTISNITLVPQAPLAIAREGSASAQITWPTNLADHVLEYDASLPGADWNAVTNVAAVVGNRLSVTVSLTASRRFYRLRRP
jgi:hypothetical protein